MMAKKHPNKLSSSFRDPSGFMFREDGILKRQINNSYAKNYELLMASGLYSMLVKKGLLIEHEELQHCCDDPRCYKLIKPFELPFISYPYEWAFGQLKDAALATLAIQKIAMKHGMSLKDASAFNIQFWKGKPVLIDTLSFEKLDRTKPWVAYRQFCQHFLAPLALSAYCDIRFIQLCRLHLDGIPLDLASKSLPAKTWLSPSLLAHIHLHANSQKKYADKKIDKQAHAMGKYALQGMVSNLIKTIGKLHWMKKDTQWGEYYSFTNYSQPAFNQKKVIIEDFINDLKDLPRSAWDLGGNNGLFSRIAGRKGIFTLSFDIDYSAVEQNYQQMKKGHEEFILPLFLDLANPSTNLGWAHQERASLAKRGPCDLAMALALIHHISISNNVPFDQVASFFAKLCKNLIIEFVPKDDSNAQKLLAMREDIFDEYDQQNFENEFSKHFVIMRKKKIENSKRTLYLMKSADYEK